MDEVKALVGRGAGRRRRNARRIDPHSLCKVIVNDPRMVATVRRLELDGDTLRYEMEMQTIAVEGLTSHLRAELRRVSN
jgi:hypothetical protein